MQRAEIFDVGLIKDSFSTFISVGNENVLRKRVNMFRVNQQCRNQRFVVGLSAHISTSTCCRVVSVRNRFTNGLSPIRIELISHHIGFHALRH
jgi:hypothetical protein